MHRHKHATVPQLINNSANTSSLTATYISSLLWTAAICGVNTTPVMPPTDAPAAAASTAAAYLPRAVGASSALWAAAAGSGVCAAAAAALGKLASGDSEQLWRALPVGIITSSDDATLLSDRADFVWLAQGALLAMSGAASAGVWIFLSRALAAAPSALEPTAIRCVAHMLATSHLESNSLPRPRLASGPHLPLSRVP
jgi:hypothetical protein